MLFKNENMIRADWTRENFKAFEFAQLQTYCIRLFLVKEKKKRQQATLKWGMGGERRKCCALRDTQTRNIAKFLKLALTWVRLDFFTSPGIFWHFPRGVNGYKKTKARSLNILSKSILSTPVLCTRNYCTKIIPNCLYLSAFIGKMILPFSGSGNVGIRVFSSLSRRASLKKKQGKTIKNFHPQWSRN